MEPNRIVTEAPSAWLDKRVGLPLTTTPAGEAILSRETWEPERARIEADWRSYLGEPPFDPASCAGEACVVREDQDDDCHARLIYLKTEPDYWEQCYLMVPHPRPLTPRPAVVVFFYDIDTPAGRDMGSARWKAGNETRQFARHLVRRGYVALVQRWFYEGNAASRQATDPWQGRYRTPWAYTVERQKRVAPHWKGLGHVVWDAGRLVDYLQTLDVVDPERIGCMGHSLGGKMALYAAAFDRRFKVAVSSEPGIGLAFSNWHAPWYLGDGAKAPDFGRDHHQLLALLAPRPFLLIAGEDADGERSWPYLNSARDVYALHDAAQHLGLYNHAGGHAPTMGACEAAYAWFDRWL